jgi:hypothetical protein
MLCVCAGNLLRVCMCVLQVINNIGFREFLELYPEVRVGLGARGFWGGGGCFGFQHGQQQGCCSRKELAGLGTHILILGG